ARYNYGAGGGVMLLDTPNPDNTMEWDHGKVRINYAVSASDKKRFAQGVSRLAVLLFKAGAKEVIIPSFEPMFPDRGVFNVLKTVEEAEAIETKLHFVENANLL